MNRFQFLLAILFPFILGSLIGWVIGSQEKDISIRWMGERVVVNDGVRDIVMGKGERYP